MNSPLPDHDDPAATLPNDQEAEQAALGAMLLSRVAIGEVSALVTTHEYYRPAHATIHAAITTMYSGGLPVDPITLAAHLREAG